MLDGECVRAEGCWVRSSLTLATGTRGDLLDLLRHSKGDDWNFGRDRECVSEDRDLK